MLVLEWKERAFIEKVNSRCFCWFPAAILVHQNGAPIWRLHTKLYKGAWNVSANNSETVGHKDLRLVYILVFYSMSFSWFLPLDGFQFNFLLRDSENDLCNRVELHLPSPIPTMAPGIVRFCPSNWMITIKVVSLDARRQMVIFRSMFLGCRNNNFWAPVRAYEIVQSNLFTTATLGTEESGHCGGEKAVMGR